RQTRWKRDWSAGVCSSDLCPLFSLPPLPGRLSVSQKRHAPGGTHFCLLRRSEILPPWYPPFRQNGALNRALAAKRLAHSQRSIALYVSRPSAHVGWTGLFCLFSPHYGLGPQLSRFIFVRLRHPDH